VAEVAVPVGFTAALLMEAWQVLIPETVEGMAALADRETTTVLAAVALEDILALEV